MLNGPFFCPNVLLTICLCHQIFHIEASETSHKYCRNVTYPRSNVERFPVSDNLVSWSASYPDYRPLFYEAPSIKGKPWADPLIEDASFHPNWNRHDVLVNRISYTGEYKIENSYPLNPFGRTGIIGRGLLGRWGPNHAADSLVTRWCRDEDGIVKRDPVSRSEILQMIAIQRRDNNIWAMPGGMVDKNETPFEAAKREFSEEAMHEAPHEDTFNISKFFDATAKSIYSGYIDDFRNTDNAWVESMAFSFHDETGEYVEHLHFKAGDDAKNLTWIDVHGDMDLYESHRNIVKIVANELNAHW